MLDKASKLTDEELAYKTLVNQDFFRFLVERYQNKLMRYILRLTSVNKQDAEDILQDVFLDVYRNLNSFDERFKFSSWIYRIAHNRVISVWRKNKNTPIIFNKEESLELFKNIASEENIVSELSKKDIQKEVEQVLAKMKKEYAEILVLKFLEEKSYIEISDILKKPMGTVATLINRAKKQFREIVESDNN